MTSRLGQKNNAGVIKCENKDLFDYVVNSDSYERLLKSNNTNRSSVQLCNNYIDSYNYYDKMSLKSKSPSVVKK